MNESLRRIAVRSYVGVLALLAVVSSGECADQPETEKASFSRKPVPMIHVTDLYRPHDDPDDHWDLACVFSLAWQGNVDLLGILIDYPQTGRENNPDVLGVAQMNYLTGKAVPVIVGSPRWIEPGDSSNADNESALRGIRTMLDILRRSPEPVVINILGSCRDVAIAGRLEPDLFAKKCAAVYLNAGSGTSDPSKAVRLEWNVHLDPRAYAAIFELPCPIYWMPCFEVIHPTPQEVSQLQGFGTFYRFRQADVLPHLSGGVQNFFAYMFMHGRHETKRRDDRSLRPNWFQYLVDSQDRALLARVNAMDRNMWCTGGFLHAVGKTVTRDGRIVPQKDTEDPVFTFDPIRVTCSADGVTKWHAASNSPRRFIFHVREKSQYPTAMTSALKGLLVELP